MILNIKKYSPFRILRGEAKKRQLLKPYSGTALVRVYVYFNENPVRIGTVAGVDPGHPVGRSDLKKYDDICIYFYFFLPFRSQLSHFFYPIVLHTRT